MLEGSLRNAGNRIRVTLRIGEGLSSNCSKLPVESSSLCDPAMAPEGRVTMSTAATPNRGTARKSANSDTLAGSVRRTRPTVLSG